LLELAGVPYVGAGVLSSALAMDKAKAKEVLGAAGLPQARYLALRDGQAVGAGDLGWPVFVKPANMGSSVGVSKVHGPDELPAAAELAFAYDEWILVEEAVVGREVECAVLGSAGQAEASVFGEIKPKAEFYDFDDKYSGEGAELVIPADLPDDVLVEGQRLALRAFDALRCDGLARVDFFYEEGGRGLLVNELNTMPGFTPYSMYPRLWEASGLPYAALIDRLVDLALARHERLSTRRGRAR
jgi:D-alanine-D-alanine ligase